MSSLRFSALAMLPVAAAALSCVLGCQERTPQIENEAAPEPIPAAPAPRADWPKTLVVGFQPFMDWDAVGQDFAPLVAHLERQCDIDVTLYRAKDYDALVDAFAAGQVHIASLSPYLYMKAWQKMQAGMTVLAQMSAAGKAHYRGLLIARKDSAFETLGALKGQHIAWVDRSSSSGYLFPRLAIGSAGLDPERHFGRHSFSGSHPAVIQAVLDRKADAGAVWQETFNALPDAQRALFRVILESPVIPPDPLCARSSLPADLRLRVARAFIGVSAALGQSDAGSPAFLEHLAITGWRSSSDADFDSLRVAFSSLGVATKREKP